MLAGRADFYSDPKACYKFLYAICVQYFRTKKMRDRIGAVPTPTPGSDIRRVAGLFTLVSAMKVAYRLYEERDHRKILHFENPTAIPLITGDQPVINLHASYGKSVPQDLELYYPLSPTRAMALVKASTRIPKTLTEDAVRQFNDQMVKSSHEQVFSNSVQHLESLC
jgi:hypothetical protein